MGSNGPLNPAPRRQPLPSPAPVARMAVRSAFIAPNRCRSLAYSSRVREGARRDALNTGRGEVQQLAFWLLRRAGRISQ